MFEVNSGLTPRLISTQRCKVCCNYAPKRSHAFDFGCYNLLIFLEYTETGLGSRVILVSFVSALLKQYVREVLCEDCCDDTGCTSKIRNIINALPEEDREDNILALLETLRSLRMAFSEKGSCTNVHFGNLGIY